MSPRVSNEAGTLFRSMHLDLQSTMLTVAPRAVTSTVLFS